MQLTKLLALVGALAATSTAVLTDNNCWHDEHNAEFPWNTTIKFVAGPDPAREPCQRFKLDEAETCYPLSSSDVAIKTRQIHFPTEGFDCWLYRENNCDSKDSLYFPPIYFYTNLPDDWAGNIGAFKCSPKSLRPQPPLTPTTLLTTTLVTTTITTASPPASSVAPPPGACYWNDPHFDPFHTVYFFDGTWGQEPCQQFIIDDRGTCYPLEPGSVAAKANRVNLPVGGWDCWFFHENNCNSKDYHVQYANGSPLPDDWSGKLGAFYCLRTG